MSDAFLSRKQSILSQLAISDRDYTDLSPKGSVDDGIRQLCHEINELDGYVTTSSCAGRVAVYLDGVPKSVPSRREDLDGEPLPSASVQSGKGGGKWLYVSHDTIDLAQIQSDEETFSLLGIAPCELSFPSSDISCRFVHFKFEPMILHILTSSFDHAVHALSSGLTSGLRESGICSLSQEPLVAIRTQGLAFDSIVAYADPVSEKVMPMVSAEYLRVLMGIANARFAINETRKCRFRMALLKLKQRTQQVEWEPAEIRRERLKKEGLRKREEQSVRASEKDTGNSEEVFPDILFQEEAPT